MGCATKARFLQQQTDLGETPTELQETGRQGGGVPEQNTYLFQSRQLIKVREERDQRGGPKNGGKAGESKIRVSNEGCPYKGKGHSSVC